MSVSTYLSASTTDPTSLDAQTLYRSVGQNSNGVITPTPGVNIGSIVWSSGSVAVSCPGISASSVVIITGYNATPNPANIWDINIDVALQNFTVVSNPGVGQAFSYMVIG